MNDDPNRAVVLTAAPTETEAEIIAAALEAQGVRAQTIGALTSGLRSGAPGGVQVMVRQANLEQAQSVLQAIERESASE